jgi:hypothetical protein
MPYRPRELVVRAREAATQLLATLDRDELVARFLDLYAAEYRRPGRADQPAFYREQLERIRRESVLVAVLRIEAALPTRLKVSVAVRGTKRRPWKRVKGRRGVKPRPRAKAALELAIPFLDLFREEFFVALGEAMDWSDEDASEFWRDLDIYRMLSTRGSARTARAKAGAASGPFADRVALLLDPSLMEQARRAAGRFQLEVHGAADRVLRKVFARRREN